MCGKRQLPQFKKRIEASSNHLMASSAWSAYARPVGMLPARVAFSLCITYWLNAQQCRQPLAAPWQLKCFNRLLRAALTSFSPATRGASNQRNLNTSLSTTYYDAVKNDSLPSLTLMLPSTALAQADITRPNMYTDKFPSLPIFWLFSKHVPSLGSRVLVVYQGRGYTENAHINRQG